MGYKGTFTDNVSKYKCHLYQHYITSNGRPFTCPVIYTDFFHNTILFMGTSKMHNAGYLIL